MKIIRDFNVKNKRVLVRCDFNVPLTEEGNILNDFRIRQTLPTIKYLVGNGAKIILMSHLGDPDGQVLEKLKMDKIQERLITLLNNNPLPKKPVAVLKADDCIGKEIEKLSKKIEPGEILLLENLRFYKEEKENDDKFAKGLAKLGDIYINDAFGTCHRNHASIVGVPKHTKKHGEGLLLEEEITALWKIMKTPAKPLVVLIGGKKVETKIKFIDSISEIADCVLLGGLLKKEIEARKISLKNPEKIIMQIEPVDGDYKYDIGPETIKIFKEKIKRAKTIFFSGAMGRIEDPEFAKGTEEVLREIAESEAYSVVGGGEMVIIVDKMQIAEKLNHVSTGGGALLAFLSGEQLPGLCALNHE